jgi:hypothetical protein
LKEVSEDNPQFLMQIIMLYTLSKSLPLGYSEKMLSVFAEADNPYSINLEREMLDLAKKMHSEMPSLKQPLLMMVAESPYMKQIELISIPMMRTLK